MSISIQDENASAEIRSIIEICKQEPNTDFEVHLIATDTVLSVLAAELICEWFNRTDNKEKPENLKNCLFAKPQEPEKFEKQDNERHIIKNLRVDNKATFEKGFMNLVSVLDKLIEKDKTILNITGGYKAIIPIITLLGQIKEVPLKYIYNDSDLKDSENPLIEVGNLPFSFDIGYIEGYVHLITDTSKIDNNKVAKKLFELGLVQKDTVPTELSIIGELIKNKLESDDLPFAKTTMGYLVEYKFYEYYAKNLPTIEDVIFDKVELGYKLSNNPDEDLEDADLWFEKNNKVIIAEIKPASVKAKILRKKIKKLANYVKDDFNLLELWILLYEYENTEIINDEQWCKTVINQDLLNEFPDINFRFKKIKIDSNTIDGNRNRLRYQEFMRREINIINELFYFDIRKKTK
jgi:hypothetical protein